MNTLNSKPESIQEVLVNATRALGMTMEYREARLQAELLLAHSLETTRAMVLARLDEELSPKLAAHYAANVARRAQHEPLAYILGHREFYGLDFIVDRRVLIPRHETELLVQLALEHARHFVAPLIVDVGTGSGAIALTLAHHLPQATIYATECSPDAIVVAKLNASHLKLTNVEFVKADLLQKLQEPFDLLTANLPYIPTDRYPRLPREIRAFEPRVALDGGIDGLGVMRRLFAQMQGLAKRASIALLEISEEQGKAALELVHCELPEAQARIYMDLEGLDRVLEVRWNIA